MLTAERLGPAKLRNFLDRNGISKRRAARDLGVSLPTVLDWLREHKNPDPSNRVAIRRYTRGEVVEPDWETEQERAANQRARRIQPYDKE